MGCGMQPEAGPIAYNKACQLAHNTSLAAQDAAAVVAIDHGCGMPHNRLADRYRVRRRLPSCQDGGHIKISFQGNQAYPLSSNITCCMLRRA